jgi:hypothetical protein
LAHTYNPSYSGGRVQEDHGLKPAWANSSRDPSLKNHHKKKRVNGVAQGVGLDFKPQDGKNPKRVVGVTQAVNCRPGFNPQ